MIYTEYQQVLLTQLQNNDKILEESPVLSPEFTQERRFPRIKG